MAPRSFKSIYVSFQCCSQWSHWGCKKSGLMCNSVFLSSTTSPSTAAFRMGQKYMYVLYFFIWIIYMKMNYIQREGQTLELHMTSMHMKSYCICYQFLYISTYIHILSSSFRKNVNSVFAGMIQTTWLRQTILTLRLSCKNHISFLWYGPLAQCRVESVRQLM